MPMGCRPCSGVVRVRHVEEKVSALASLDSEESGGRTQNAAEWTRSPTDWDPTMKLTRNPGPLGHEDLISR